MAVTRIRAAASRSGLSLAAYISASIRCAQWNARHAGMLVWLEYDGARYQAQLPAPGLVTRCPCHPPVEASNATADGTGTLVPKITHQARAELRALARENPAGALTMTDYVEAATWVEQWNHDHRNCRVVVERDDGRYELLLPFAGIVSGRTAPVGERGH
ncbi:MAG: hypothetical protein GY773_23300 [Actinomycetia bacterium]|nr:hypothetical protein [Actinomycetes bacterium]